MKQIDVYVRNMAQSGGNTFKVNIQEEVQSRRKGSTLYTVLSAMFSFTICCLCVLACCRCFMSKSMMIDYNVDEPNSNWDND